MGRSLAVRTREAAAPAEPAPTVDELSSVLALVIVSDLNIEQIGERTGMSPTGTEAAIAALQEQTIVFDSGGAYYRATQARCPGPCRRQGHELRGQQVVINAKTFRWICAECHDAERGRERATGSDDS